MIGEVRCRVGPRALKDFLNRYRLSDNATEVRFALANNADTGEAIIVMGIEDLTVAADRREARQIIAMVEGMLSICPSERGWSWEPLIEALRTWATLH